MTRSSSQKLFRVIVKSLPRPVACALDRWNPGCLMRLGFGIEKTLPDDLYIASYPRSGNTWTRYILAYLKVGVARPLTSEEVGGIAPGVYNNLSHINSATTNRLIKTHDPLFYLYPRAIYVHRDPRESLVSYWHFARRTGIFAGSFSEFLRSPVSRRHGSWKKHMRAMHQKLIDDPKSIHVIRYEQLRHDFHKTVSSLIDWCGFGSEVDLDELHRLTSLESMASSDKECDTIFRRKSGESFFVDRGKGSDWRNVWAQADIDWLAKDREMISIMERNGYFL